MINTGYKKDKTLWIMFWVCLVFFGLIPMNTWAAVSEDYAPLLGTQWTLTSVTGSGNLVDTITFDASTYVSDIDSDVYLNCTSSLYNPTAGTAYYEGSSYNLYFLFSSSGTYYWAVYIINVSDDTASGVNAYYDYDTSALITEYNTSGNKTFPVIGPVSVEFDACPTSGKAPLGVQFTNKSQGVIDSWLWNFGDGATSTQENPSHTYAADGSYTVVLTTTNTSGSYSETKTGFIKVTEEVYRFNRMWPNLQQPWYFKYVRHLARDNDGNIYVANSGEDRIVKLTSDGQFISNFGEGGSGNGQFQMPYGVAVDDLGNVYVTDLGRKPDNSYDEQAWRVLKFDSAGQFLSSWKNVTGTGDVLNKPTGISVDWDGNILVADSGNKRIVKYAPDGTFIAQLDGYGTNSFNWPTDVKSDKNGMIYVVDQTDNKVHKFSAFSTDSYVKSWDAIETGTAFDHPTSVDIDDEGNLYVTDYAYHANNRVIKISAADDQATVLIENGLGFGEKQLWGPFGLVVDPSGYLYVGGYWGGSVSKFTLTGEFINKWSSASDRTGYFSNPHAIAVDPAGNIYVADSANYRIQKINASDGSIISWGSKGTGDGQFEGDPDGHQGPHAIAIHPNGHVYVADTLNNRVQVFDSNGVFISKIVGLTHPSGLAIDPAGNIYVAEWSYSHQIKKFDVNGNQLAGWGGQGSSDGQFNNPHGLAVDDNGHIYVADADNNRIQIFDKNGNFIGKWGSYGQNDGELNQPWDVAIDNDGNVLVADTYNDRIQHFTPSGCFLESFGGKGSLPGQFSQPQGIAVGSDGFLFVLETTNNRVQKFKKSVLDKNKAIVLAGGGPYEENYLWDATRVNANFAYLTLTYQGFTKDSIYYLTPETGLDLDNNGLADDVDGDATVDNLHTAVTTWAADATNLIIYLVDHGGNGIFRMNKNETLAAADLKNWADTLQDTIPGRVVIIYDACESGSFLPGLIPPEGKERITVSSAQSNESAYFVSRGAISFSKYFWTNIYKGRNINVAFNAAKDAISAAVGSQHPLLDDNGNGNGNEAGDGVLAANHFIGNGTSIQDHAAVFGSVSASQVAGTDTVLLNVNNVTDSEDIARVWAVITPPGYLNPSASDNTVQELPFCDLQSKGNDNFEGTCDGFYFSGTYTLDFYTMDRVGNTSAPVQASVTVTDPLTRKAIIVAGSNLSDSFWPAVSGNAELAYNALRFQGYPDDNIYYLSPASSDTGVDAAATLNELDNAVNTWAKDNTRDLVLYMVGNGAPGIFRINGSESLSVVDLDAWLDGLQGVIPGKVVFIYDATGSGSFLTELTPPAGKERIFISSTLGTQSTDFGGEGNISFSRYFWERILKGNTVWGAFSYARTAIEGWTKRQTPQLEDDGNGTGNEPADGKTARTCTIGMGIQLSGNEPRSGDTVADLNLNGETSAGIWIDHVSSTNTVDKVYLVITPPGSLPFLPGLPQPDQSTIELTDDGSGRYSGTYNGFSTYGNYSAGIYVKDIDGNLSIPKNITIYQAAGPDVFEDDDGVSQAGVIVVNAGDAQRHNSHDQGDEDWVMFYGIAGESYDFKTEDIGANSHTKITLYDTDGTTVIQTIKNPDYAAGDYESFLNCPSDGIYYLKVTQTDPDNFGAGSQYDLWLIHPVGGVAGMLVGRIIDAFGNGIANAVIEAITGNFNIKSISLPSGYYMLTLPAGTFSISSSASGFNVQTVAGVNIQASGVTSRNITMESDDSIPPTAPGNLISTPAKGIWTNDNTVSVTWTAGSDADSDVAGYSFLWDTIADTVPDSTVETGELVANSPVLADGVGHYFHIVTVDNSGNASFAVHYGPFMIDTSPPSATIINVPSETVSVDSIDVTIDGTDVVQYKFKLDDGNYGSAFDVGEHIVKNNLTEGTHTLYIIGKDSAGNWQAVANASVASWEIRMAIPGNINGDDILDLADAILALKIVCDADTGSENIKISADVNGDDKIGVEEVIYILQKVSK